jgi:hypothetical protein
MQLENDGQQQVPSETSEAEKPYTSTIIQPTPELVGKMLKALDRIRNASVRNEFDLGDRGRMIELGELLANPLGQTDIIRKMEESSMGFGKVLLVPTTIPVIKDDHVMDLRGKLHGLIFDTVQMSIPGHNPSLAPINYGRWHVLGHFLADIGQADEARSTEYHALVNASRATLRMGGVPDNIGL